MRRTLVALFAAIAAVGAGPAVAADGESVYSQQCAACHGKSGEGMPYVAPPLKGAEFMKTAGLDEVIQVIRAGRAADQKKHPTFPSVMPPFPNLSDEEIKAVAEYIKEPLQK